MKYENGYVDSFRRLIQCPTVTESGHEYFEAFHKVLDEEFPHVAATCEKIELGRDVLLYKWTGKDSRSEEHTSELQSLRSNAYCLVWV